MRLSQPPHFVPQRQELFLTFLLFSRFLQVQTGPLGPSARPLLALFVQPGLSARHLFVREEPSRPFVQLRLERLEPSRLLLGFGLGGLSKSEICWPLLALPEQLGLFAQRRFVRKGRFCLLFGFGLSGLSRLSHLLSPAWAA